MNMHPQHTAAPFGQYLHITARLGFLHDGEGIFLTRHRQVHPVITGDLHEYARVRPTFVSLAGGMLEAWAEFSRRGQLQAITYRKPYFLYPFARPGITVDIARRAT